MPHTVIEVENLSKYYRLGVIGGGTLREDVNRWWAKIRGRPDPSLKVGVVNHGNREGEEIWALRDVSFHVQEGEILGVIGRNGAGKSTLLKILSRITSPTQGRAVIRGRVGSLLEVGTGFHPELTGRENIFLNGAILGMTKAEIGRKLDEIVEFAEIAEFVDTPVKRYSSGMTVRLAFAVAVHLEPEILVVDEVLAVGDVGFQKKCLAKMADVSRKEGRTVLFVSHNMASVSALCTRGVYLEHGKVGLDGPTKDVVDRYMAAFAGQAQISLAERDERQGTGQLRVTDFWMEDAASGRQLTRVMLGQRVRFCFAYESNLKVRDLYVAFDLYKQFGDPIINCNTADRGARLTDLPARGVFTCTIDRFPLRAGRYIGNVYVSSNGVVCDFIKAALRVDVEDGDYFGAGSLTDRSQVVVPYAWTAG